MQRTIALRLIACLLAGFLIQSLVAIVIALRAPFNASTSWDMQLYSFGWASGEAEDFELWHVMSEGDELIDLDRRHREATEVCDALWPRSELMSIPHDGFLGTVYQYRLSGLSITSTLVMWTDVSGPERQAGIWGKAQSYLAGWPLLSMRATVDSSGAIHGGTLALRSLVHPERTKILRTPALPPVRPLVPLTPRPAQTLANTLIYAIPCMVIAFAIPAIRSHRRRKRNACHACGYSRTALPDASAHCPECGTAPRPPRAPSSPAARPTPDAESQIPDA